jgi:hypothetical protein
MIHIETAQRFSSHKKHCNKSHHRLQSPRERRGKTTERNTLEDHRTGSTFAGIEGFGMEGCFSSSLECNKIFSL